MFGAKKEEPVKVDEYAGERVPLPGVRSEIGINFSEDGVMDLHVSKEAPSPAPLVVYFCSAAMGDGGRHIADEICRAVAARGCAVLNVGTRPLSDDCVARSLDDCRRVLDWVIRDADSRDLDRRRVYFAGTGLGALQAAWAAFLCTDNRLRRGMGVVRKALVPAGYVALSPVTGPDTKEMKAIFSNVRRIDRSMPDAVDLATNNGIGSLPDSFIVSGSGEGSNSDSSELKGLLDQFGVPCRWMSFEDGRGLEPGFVERSPWLPQSVRAVSAMTMFFGGA